MTARRGRIRRWLLIAAAAVVLGPPLLILPLRWIPPLTTSFMIQNWLAQRSVSAKVRYEWVPREQINRQAALAVLASEDQKFFDHPGFDLEAINKTLKRSKGHLPKRGASTISQQVAKNMFLWPARSWFRKGLEAYLTLWIEWLWPKERILEVYLNIAQFGPHEFGVEAASQRFFGKPAQRLNRPEAALLAAVLPNPRMLRVKNPSRYVRRRQAWIQWQAGRMAADLPGSRWTPRR